MNKQAKWLLLIALLLLTALSAGGVGAWVDADTDPAAAPAVDDESAMPPLVGGAPTEPQTPPARPPLPAARPGVNFQDSPNAPTITIWNGASQQFGLKGDPQKWVNILGNVSSAVPLSSLTYTVNGGPPQALQTGPDNMRLALAGDFNIELDYTDLLPGANQVVITALDNSLVSSQALVTVNYAAAPAWTPQTYTVNWAGATKVNDVAQAIDGQWTIDNGTARPTIMEFDRLVAIGDLSWRDYTVTVPVTILAMDPAGYTGPSNGPGIGVMVRWQGHYWADGDTQPRTGWRRLGALGWYRWKNNPAPAEGLQLLGHRGLLLGESTRTLSFNTPYIFKISVTSNANPSKPATYRFKVWEAAQAEPATWDFEQQGNSGEPDSGSVVLLAHHVDARFGNVTVNLASVAPKPTLTTQISGTGTGTIDRVPQKATYRFGEDVTLTATPTSGSTFQSWGGDLTGTANPATLEIFGDSTVSALFVNPNVQTPISDDFSGCELDGQIWTYIDPLGDTPLQMTGSQAQISVPAGTGHDIWTGGVNAPRLMQYAENEDFEFEVKFDSVLGAKNQAQGVLVQGDAQNFLRYNYLHDGTSYRIQAYTFLLGQPTTRVDTAITIVPPMYLRVKRVGNVWNLFYSANGTNWSLAAGFQHDLVVSSYGPYIGNSSKNPATDGLIDYFFNTKSPIVPEDNDRKLTVNVAPSGGGTVVRDPIKENYACDEPVTLTPVPNTGYRFDHWSGDLTGTADPGTLIMNATKTVTANFVADTQYTVTVSASPLGAGTVTKSPDKPAYSAGESVTLTATPAAGNLFTSWSGGASGSVNPLTVVVNSNLNIVANFAPAPQRTLTVTVNGPGSVAKSPDKPTYLNGETVTLTAVPNANASFIGWSGALTGATTPTTLVMDADKAVTATFAENIYTLTLVPGPNGSITASPNKPAYYQNEVVTLTAVPAPGYKLVAWGGDLSGSANPATLVMTKNSTVSATFVLDESFTVDVTTVGNGIVVRDPDQPTYNFGQQVTLTAFPLSGAEFVGWSGDLSGNQNPVTITVDGDKAITATFAAAGVYSLTIVPPTNGTIQVDPVRPLYAPGEQVTLTAVPSFGYIFSAWGNDATGTSSPLVLTMDGNKTVSAIFTIAPIYTVNVTSAGNGSVAVDPPGTQFTAGTQITLTATPEEGYYFAGWAGDLESASNPHVLTVDGNKNIIAQFSDRPPAMSDDFDGCAIDPMWTWTDPLGLADYQMTGTQVKIVVPPNANYEIWRNGNDAARLTQEVGNVPNFSMIVKMQSPVTQGYQVQGVLIEASDDEFIRIDIFNDGQQVKYFAGVVKNGVGNIKKNVPITLSGSDIYLRIQRNGNDWRLFYRFSDSGPWTGVGKFTHTIEVQRVGIFAGSNKPSNAQPAPGHTAVFDYFFNADAPIDPEDANAPSLTINKVGQGNVTTTPAGPNYACGQQIQLRATPASGWVFQNWSGDLNGTGATRSLTISGQHTVSANFIQRSSYDLFLPVAIR